MLAQVLNKELGLSKIDVIERVYLIKPSLYCRSWNGLDYNMDCLALYTGTGHPGGSIDTSCLGKKQPSVCADPTESYGPPPEDAEVANAIPSIAEGVDSSLASSEGEQESDMPEKSLGLENEDWLLDVQNSMYEYRMDPDIN
jgi:hypothetical protein